MLRDHSENTCRAIRFENELHCGVVREAPVAKKQQGITYDRVRRMGLALPKVEKARPTARPR